MNGDWGALMEEHRQAVARFARDAGALAEARWQEPLGPDKWTFGQVVEHVLLSYQVVNRELSGGVGMRVRTTWWKRLWIRRRYLPPILRDGRLPEGAKAVREIRPQQAARPKADCLAEISSVTHTFEKEIEGARLRGKGLTHAIFGALDPTSSLRFMAIHTEHHRRQLAGDGA